MFLWSQGHHRGEEGPFALCDLNISPVPQLPHNFTPFKYLSLPLGHFAYEFWLLSSREAMGLPGQFKEPRVRRMSAIKCCHVVTVCGRHRGRVRAFRKLLQWARSSRITCLVLPYGPESASSFQGQCSVTLPSCELLQCFISSSHRHFSAFGRHNVITFVHRHGFTSRLS